MAVSLARVMSTALAKAGRVRLTTGIFSFVLTVAAAGLASTAPALADFRVCNATQNLVGVAIGSRAKAGWVT